MVNKCGPWHSPLPGLPLVSQRSHFPGLSSIADSDGSLLAQLGAEQGVIVEDVTLDPARKKTHLPARRGRWALDVPWAASLFQLVEAAGGLWYRRSAKRRRRARAISAGG
jgi:N-carbamoylputrescine amidase